MTATVGSEAAVTLTIDGRELSVPTGALIVDAARQVGIDIPVFCYHPKLSAAGTCRMCLVEVGTPAVDQSTGEPVVHWSPDLQTACTTPVAQGMVVRTQTERVASARRDVIGALLADHPRDCPTCDKGGECSLQDQTMAFGLGSGRAGLGDEQRRDRRVSRRNLLILNRERCIRCGRCGRFQDEISGDPVLSLDQQSGLVAFSDPPVESYFGGNITDICPTGALTTTDLMRPWELTGHASLCNHCPVGCNIALDTRIVPPLLSAPKTGQIQNQQSEIRNREAGRWVVKRVVPRQNEKVNEIWICDKGRYGHHHAHAADRLTVPLVRKTCPEPGRRDGKLTQATWEQALGLIAKRIRLFPPAQIAGVAGDRLSNEDFFLFQALMRDVIGTPHLDTYPHTPGADLVARYGVGADSDWERLDQNSVILVVAGDVEEQAPIWFLRIKSAARRGARLIVVNGRETSLDRYATHRLRVRYGSAAHLLLGMTRLALKVEACVASRRDEVGNIELLEDNLSGFGPAAVERLTGITAEDLKAVAEIFAQAEDAIVIFGREGLNDYGALALAQAAANLSLATSHVGRANNGLLPLWPHNNTQGAADMGVRPNAGPGYKEIIEHGWDFGSMLTSASNGSVKFMWIVGADPVGDDPATAQSLAGLNFLVVQELFLTDTARQADVVLPALSFAERDGTYTSGERRVQRFEQALPPLEQARADWAILADAAGRLGAEWDFGSSASVLAAISQAVPQYAGMTLDALRATEPQWPPAGRDALCFSGSARRNENEGGLGLRWRAAAEQNDFEPAFDWVELPALRDADLTAVPVRWLYRQGTLIARSALLRECLRGAVAEFSPHDAARLDLEQDFQINASLGQTRVELAVCINSRVPEGVVLVPAHLPTGPFVVERVRRPGP